MLIIGFVIAGVFIFLICFIVRGYLEDIIELENRILQLEKRINEKASIDYVDKIHCNEMEIIEDCYHVIEKLKRKDGEKEMACKGKGKGGKRK